ncbi:MAG: YihY/virulence factor BrkB family protein [Lachnospiraceae bacterium]|nr:YihY/virulence factor BrkB family protein [Lachnospiraceae bacterium]
MRRVSREKLIEAATFGFRVFMKSSRDRIGTYAAQAAFYILMSVFPFLILLLQLLSRTLISRETIYLALDSVLPEYLLPTLHSILEELYSGGFGLVPVTVLTALWAASKAMYALNTGLDVICRAEEIRSWLVIRLWSILYTVVFVFITAAGIASSVFWQALRGFILENRPGFIPLFVFSTAFRAFYTLLILTLLFLIMYKFFPHKRLRFKDQLPGALFAAGAWYIFSEVVRIYVTGFNGFSMYGSLSTLTLVMFWLYFCCYFVMMGAEINELLRRERKD